MAFKLNQFWQGTSPGWPSGRKSNVLNTLWGSSAGTVGKAPLDSLGVYGDIAGTLRKTKSNVVTTLGENSAGTVGKQM